MLTRFFFILVGFGFTLIGFIYIISYLNLLTIGYNFLEYVYFIIRRVECWYAFIGIVILMFSISFNGKEDKNELYM